MKICIVGGGSAGWMTATTLSNLLDCENITLIESPNTPTSGVGESTHRRFTAWLELLDIKGEEFLKETGGSIKHSIKFTNFLKKDSGSFHYPFGEPHFESSLAWMCIEEGRFTHNDYAKQINPLAVVADMGKVDWTADLSFHLDAVKFAQYLRKNHCEDVDYISADVVGFEESEKGIESLTLDDGSTVTADLFVDCTGFSSLLLGQYLKEPFVPYDNILPNDTAWATQVPYTDKEKELVAYTECTAIENGWVWNIPLWDKVGTGYVYSSKHVSDEDAKQELIKQLETRGYDISECEFRKLPMKIGRYERSFVKNVVAIGLSAGFIEPLESNGLFTVHENLIDLWKTLRRGVPSQYMKDAYNAGTSYNFDEFAEFVAIHYVFTQRDDTQYWRDLMNKDYDIVGDKNYDKYGMLAYTREMYQHNEFRYPDRGFHYIASGMNVSAYTVPKNNPNQMPICEMKRREWEDWIGENLPTVYESLRKDIHGE